MLSFPVILAVAVFLANYCEVIFFLACQTNITT